MAARARQNGGGTATCNLRVGYHVVGVITDANGFGKTDILMAKRLRT